MNRYNLEEEEITGNELNSVAFTTGSLVVIVISVVTWVFFT
jgi:hypothetical protein